MAFKYVYTIYDKVASEMGQLMVFNNDEHARRMYPMAFKNHPEVKTGDFMLCKLGTINPESMIFDKLEIPEDITPVMEVSE